MCQPELRGTPKWSKEWGTWKALGYAADPLIDFPGIIALAISFKLVPRQWISRAFFLYWPHDVQQYKQQYGKAPVFIIDNANKLPPWEPRLLEAIQDFAKHASDNGIAAAIFISGEGVPTAFEVI
jgi:hypothetical protein